jgi:Flp pilus assembly pilin Flp
MSAALNSIVVRVQNAWFAARDKESGQTLVEYALIIALVSLAAIVALGFLSGKINNLFSRAGNSLNTVTTP